MIQDSGYSLAQISIRASAMTARVCYAVMTGSVLKFGFL